MTQTHVARLWIAVLAGTGLLLLAAPASALDLRTWDQRIDSGRSRFQVLRSFNNEAVLDKETQLVWERSPVTTTNVWVAALFVCIERTVGGRTGWRLPSAHELASLIDPSQSNPVLPGGHPFSNVQTYFYWSASTVADLPSAAWFVHFGAGDVSIEVKTEFFYVWCVRGGIPGPDTY